LAIATISLSEFTGAAGFAWTVIGIDAISPIGAKSLMMS
jgi:hypothetical protein